MRRRAKAPVFGTNTLLLMLRVNGRGCPADNASLPNCA